MQLLQVVEVLEKEINESAWFGLAFLVDGFPRILSQVKTFEERIRPSDLVLYFECPEEVMLQRLTERSKTSGRSDDTPSSVKQRLKTFKKETLPLVEFFQAQGKLHKCDSALSSQASPSPLYLVAVLSQVSIVALEDKKISQRRGE